jgi:exodeoxyribonuclease VII large subunit
MQSSLGIATRVPVLSVSELNRRLRTSLDVTFNSVWVAGEISNFRIPSSGHFYFSLKDARSQIAAVMFRSANRFLRFRPHDGLEVVLRGRVSLYEARGDLQLYVDMLEPCGVGSQQLALEQLRQRLAADGLFDATRKRALPFWPRAVGVATALGGAAVHDIASTLRRRMPAVRIIIRPVRVQGPGAWPELVAALADLNAIRDVDVIIIGRGGGSLEDLWAFNEEMVVRAVATSRVPVVSAVGHEVDVTLTDLAADQRAATPTAAAALVIPDQRELQLQVARSVARLAQTVSHRLRHERRAVAGLARRVRHPRQLLSGQRLRLDELAERAGRAMAATLRLARHRMAGGAARLEALSPLAVLQRGYAIARRNDDGSVVRNARSLTIGDILELILAEGSARVRVLGAVTRSADDEEQIQ